MTKEEFLKQMAELCQQYEKDSNTPVTVGCSVSFWYSPLRKEDEYLYNGEKMVPDPFTDL